MPLHIAQQYALHIKTEDLSMIFLSDPFLKDVVEIHARSHWDILNEIDAPLNDRMSEWRNYINTSNDYLERKYRELIMVSMACLQHNSEGIRVHMGLARKNGATEKQIYGAVTQSFFMGGIPALKEGLLAYDELFLSH